MPSFDLQYSSASVHFKWASQQMGKSTQTRKIKTSVLRWHTYPHCGELGQNKSGDSGGVVSGTVQRPKGSVCDSSLEDESTDGIEAPSSTPT